MAGALATIGLTADASAGKGVMIAVLDNDLKEDLLHETSVTRLSPAGLDHVPFTIPPDDPNLHGTAVCALIAKAAPAAEILWLSRPEEILFWFPLLLRTARTHASGQPLVVNLSWTYRLDALSEVEQFRLTQVLDGVLADAMFDCLIIAAAGNVTGSDTNTPMGYPARSDYVLAVAGADDELSLSPRSRRGKPQGPWCSAPSGSGSPAGLIEISGHRFHGTSMACALASGLAAVEFGERAASRPPEIMERLTTELAHGPSHLLRRTPTNP